MQAHAVAESVRIAIASGDLGSWHATARLRGDLFQPPRDRIERLETLVGWIKYSRQPASIGPYCLTDPTVKRGEGVDHVPQLGQRDR